MTYDLKFGLVNRTTQSYYAKAKYVVELIAFGNNQARNDVRKACEERNITVEAYDQSFDAGFTSLCNTILYPGMSKDGLQMRRVGDMSYVSVYDAIKWKKRQRESI